MSDPIDDNARRAWHQQGPGTGPAQTAINIERHVLEQRRRRQRFTASAAIIVPGWIAIFWLFPDLRPVAATGLAAGASLAWLVFRRGSAARRDAAVSCVEYQTSVLESERDFHRAMPKYMVPVLLGQIAIVVTLLVNPRFNKGGSFAMLLTLFVVTVVGILLFITGRSRRILREVERELAILGKAVEV